MNEVWDEIDFVMQIDIGDLHWSNDVLLVFYLSFCSYRN